MGVAQTRGATRGVRLHLVVGRERPGRVAVALVRAPGIALLAGQRVHGFAGGAHRLAKVHAIEQLAVEGAREQQRGVVLHLPACRHHRPRAHLDEGQRQARRQRGIAAAARRGRALAVATRVAAVDEHHIGHRIELLHIGRGQHLLLAEHHAGLAQVARIAALADAADPLVHHAMAAQVDQPVRLFQQRKADLLETGGRTEQHGLPPGALVVGEQIAHRLGLELRARQVREAQRLARRVGPAGGAGCADDERVKVSRHLRNAAKVFGGALAHHAGVNRKRPWPVAVFTATQRRAQQLPRVAGGAVVDHQHRVVEVGQAVFEVDRQQHLEQHAAQLRVGRVGDTVGAERLAVADAVDELGETFDVGLHPRGLDPGAFADQLEAQAAECVGLDDQSLPDRVAAAGPVATQAAGALFEQIGRPAHALLPFRALEQTPQFVSGVERGGLLDLDDLELADVHAFGAPAEPVLQQLGRAPHAKQQPGQTVAHGDGLHMRADQHRRQPQVDRALLGHVGIARDMLKGIAQHAAGHGVGKHAGREFAHLAEAQQHRARIVGLVVVAHRRTQVMPGAAGARKQPQVDRLLQLAAQFFIDPLRRTRRRFVLVVPHQQRKLRVVEPAVNDPHLDRTNRGVVAIAATAVTTEEQRLQGRVVLGQQRCTWGAPDTLGRVAVASHRALLR